MTNHYDATQKFDPMMHYLGEKFPVPDFKHRFHLVSDWRKVLSFRLNKQGLDSANPEARVLTLFKMRNEKGTPYIECMDRLVYEKLFPQILNGTGGLDYRNIATACADDGWRVLIPEEHWEHGRFQEDVPVYLVGNKARSLETFMIWDQECAVNAGLLKVVMKKPATS